MATLCWFHGVFQRRLCRLAAWRNQLAVDGQQLVAVAVQRVLHRQLPGRLAHPLVAGPGRSTSPAQATIRQSSAGSASTKPSTPSVSSSRRRSWTAGDAGQSAGGRLRDAQAARVVESGQHQGVGGGSNKAPDRRPGRRKSPAAGAVAGRRSSAAPPPAHDQQPHRRAGGGQPLDGADRRGQPLAA